MVIQDGNQGASKAADEPKKIGYKLFKDGRETASYFRHLLTCLTPNQDLNEVRVVARWFNADLSVHQSFQSCPELLCCGPV